MDPSASEALARMREAYGRSVPGRLIAVWKMRRSVPYDLKATDLVPWCEREGIPLEDARLVAREEYPDEPRDVYVEWPVPERTEGATFEGYIPVTEPRRKRKR